MLPDCRQHRWRIGYNSGVLLEIGGRSIFSLVLSHHSKTLKVVSLYLPIQLVTQQSNWELSSSSSTLGTTEWRCEQDKFTTESSKASTDHHHSSSTDHHHSSSTDHHHSSSTKFDVSQRNQHQAFETRKRLDRASRELKTRMLDSTIREILLLCR